MRLQTALIGAAALATSTFAQTASYCPGNGVCYAVNVPSASASSGSGDIYFQITGPTTMSWVALGQGTQMAGANIFMVYTDSSGLNVTLSPRLGTGERQPQSDTDAKVTLLGGSGVSNDIMTANVRCSNCNSWNGGSMSFTDSSSDWIWSYKVGSEVNSDDVSASLSQHTHMGTTNFNLVSATGGSSNNPFTQSDVSTVSNGGSGSDSSSTGTGTNGSASTGTVGTSSDSSSSKYNNILRAHAVLGPLAFALFFPLGAITIRAFSFPGLVWMHAGWMAFTYVLVLITMSLGIWLGVHSSQIDTYHAIIGLVVVCGLILQPISGLLHHSLYKSRGRPNVATYPHIWWGRILITLGIINGGLGLKLAGNTRGGEIAYGVVAGLIWITWMLVLVLAAVKSRNTTEGETGEKLFGSHSHEGLRKNSVQANSYHGSK